MPWDVGGMRITRVVELVMPFPVDGFHNTSAYFVDAGFGLTVLDNLIPAGPLQSSAGTRELAPVIHASLSGG